MTTILRAKLSGRLLCAAFALLSGLTQAAHAFAVDGAPNGALVASGKLDNTGCLSCHDGKKEKPEVETTDGDMRPLAPVHPDKFGKSVHKQLQCVDCHVNIVDSQAQHKKTGEDARPDCATCHTKLWEQAQTEGKSAEKPRFGVVVQNIEAYKKSFHARKNADDDTRSNATCHECHNSHEFNVPPRDQPEHTEWHLATPALCGNCHEEQLEEYAESIHGKAVEEGDMDAATCVDCHTVHDIGATAASPVRLDITLSCGNCHEENLKTYRGTYHGKVGALGYAYTAKCFDCHGSHGILASDDPESVTHPDNRLETCQKCHTDKKPGMRTATPGFITFEPHAHSNDFAKYPEMWIVTKFMIALLIGVFLFFWTHSLLWYYREWKESKEGKHATWVHPEAMPPVDERKFFQRFPLGWRIAHLCFALITMTLVLTGTTALFAESPWAPTVAKFFGGPQVLGLIHRVAATLFIGIFFIHFIYVMQKLLRDRSFCWFGPDSLIPNWKDLRDCVGMFKWFFGKGPKPQFDRWTYFEKFDYWAVFWGVSIIGMSGLMLAFPHVTATYLPGWVFNVATVIHGEEAFLAAVFLFTVHFFNNHFRPEKMPPPDIVMFTGAQSLDDFRNDHPAQYRRLLESGELEKYLVDAPSQRMTLGSKILGIALILVGLTLLALVAVGFFS